MSSIAHSRPPFGVPAYKESRFPVSKPADKPISAQPISKDCLQIQFAGKKSKFSAVELKQLTDSILLHTKPAADADKNAIETAIAQAISSGLPQPLKGQEFRLGIIYPNGQIKTNDPLFEKIGKYLLKKMPPETIPAEGLAIAVRERGTETYKAVEDFLEKQVIPYFQINRKVTTIDKEKKEKEVEVLQTVAWPFFEKVISGDPLPEKYKNLADELGKLPLFTIKSPTTEKNQKLLEEQFLPMKKRLSALETATMQYSDRVHISEVIASMTAGSIIGAGGEILIHTNIPEGGPAAAAARTGTLVFIDMVDGMFGEMGVLMSDLEANGMELTLDSVYGPNKEGKPKTWWQIIKNPFGWKGKAAPFAKRAASSAVKGATLGAVLSAPAGIVLTSPGASIATRALTGGTGTLGTATSIPFNIRATLPQVYMATRALIDEGKIDVPEDIKNDEKKLKNFATALAQQDLLSRLGFAASMKAYSLTPLSGLILFSETIGVPREVAQTIFMGVAPAMENLLRLILTMSRLKLSNPKNMAYAEGLILDSGDTPFASKQKTKLQRLFADRWGRGIAWALTNVPWPVRLPELAKAKPIVQSTEKAT